MDIKISLNTEPHKAEVGPHTLLFQPEIFGGEFLDTYNRLQEVQKEFSDADFETMSGDQLRNLYQEMRNFLCRLMTPESAAEFSRFVIVAVADRSNVLEEFRTREEAESHAKEIKTPTAIEDKSMRLPDRALIQLMEWVVTLYGGTSARPTGSSSGSARSSSKTGTRGKGASRSRASIRASGTSAPS
ncbi:hypothetical protein [Streptomyces sp. NPDC047070]|uniref:hypothetical protein n=1 Tax=Streptomyces sp. NPDC047070 TaxID=3154923 RepID=UPI003453C235